MKKIQIEVDDFRLPAGLYDTATARAILEILPVTGSANVWGDEIYFNILLHLEQEPDARQEAEVGELGFWPVGDAFCIFFGPTPVSTNDKPRAYSPVNIFGKITGDSSVLKKVKNGATVKVYKEE